MKKKLRLGILFGGKSAEHEVSLQSAKNVIDALDKKKYEVVLIGIDKKGRWFMNDTSRFLLRTENQKLVALNKKGVKSIVLAPESAGKLTTPHSPRTRDKIDVIFPILHGPFGEDGTVQGLLKLTHIPFVGAGVLGSAVGMDKDVMKRLLRDAGIPTAQFLVFHDYQTPTYKEIGRSLGVPFFVKPANLGSSVGVSKVHNKNEFRKAIRDAFLYDRKILAEEYVRGREIECAVLGNDEPIASLPGEVIPTHEFYSYEAKYIDEHGASLRVPADLPHHLVKKIQILAIKVFKTLACEGIGRVDFFLKKNGEVVVSEINTIPGFTTISMYPRLWAASGIPYSKLIDTLITLARDRFKKEQKLKTTHN